MYYKAMGSAQEERQRWEPVGILGEGQVGWDGWEKGSGRGSKRVKG